MKKEYSIMVEKKIVEWSCDMQGCTVTTKDNHGCCGSAPIMTCDFCGKHMCGGHRNFYTEKDWEDYPHGLWSCDECDPKAKAAWSIAQDVANRHEDMNDVHKKVFNSIDEYVDFY